MGGRSPGPSTTWGRCLNPPPPPPPACAAAVRHRAANLGTQTDCTCRVARGNKWGKGCAADCMQELVFEGSGGIKWNGQEAYAFVRERLTGVRAAMSMTKRRESAAFLDSVACAPATPPASAYGATGSESLLPTPRPDSESHVPVRRAGAGLQQRQRRLRPSTRPPTASTGPSPSLTSAPIRLPHQVRVA